jgi:hypothetical protein
MLAVDPQDSLSGQVATDDLESTYVVQRQRKPATELSQSLCVRSDGRDDLLGGRSRQPSGVGLMFLRDVMSVRWSIVNERTIGLEMRDGPQAAIAGSTRRSESAGLLHQARDGVGALLVARIRE